METRKEISTPLGQHKVIIKTILTGGEKEKILQAPFKYATTKDGINWEVTQPEKFATAEKHAVLEASVVSIDGDSTTILDRLRKMYEPDYDFVYNEVVETQKKMKAETLGALS